MFHVMEGKSKPRSYCYSDRDKAIMRGTKVTRDFANYWRVEYDGKHTTTIGKPSRFEGLMLVKGGHLS